MKYVKGILKFIIIFILVILSILLTDFIRIQIFYRINNFEEVSIIDGYKDKYVPQSITYSSKYNIILQTSYNDDHKASMLYVIDFNSDKVIKKLRLIEPDGSENTKHVGGITTNNDIVWITSDYEIEEYSLDEIINTNDDYIKSTKRDKLYNRGDACVFYDNMLWIADFYLYPIYKVPDNNPLLLAYPIDNTDYNKPKYAVGLPRMVQGIAFTNDGKMILTQSYTYLINSKMKVYNNISYNDTIKIKDNEIPYHKLTRNDMNDNIVLPPMAEGLFYKDKSAYILFESASTKYSLADPKLKKLIKYNIN